MMATYVTSSTEIQLVKCVSLGGCERTSMPCQQLCPAITSTDSQHAYHNQQSRLRSPSKKLIPPPLEILLSSNPSFFIRERRLPLPIPPLLLIEISIREPAPLVVDLRRRQERTQRPLARTPADSKALMRSQRRRRERLDKAVSFVIRLGPAFTWRLRLGRCFPALAPVGVGYCAIGRTRAMA
jgi:hypothetical protein